MTKKFIVDISTFQRNIDYAKLAKAVDGVIIRCGYRGWGSSGTLKEDEYFKTHISNCIKHGIPVGVYWFAQEVTKAEGVEAADFVYTLIKGYKLDLPVYYDSEGSTAPNGTGRADKISKSVRTEATIGFCEQIKNLATRPVFTLLKVGLTHTLNLTVSKVTQFGLLVTALTQARQGESLPLLFMICGSTLQRAEWMATVTISM